MSTKIKELVEVMVFCSNCRQKAVYKIFEDNDTYHLSCCFCSHSLVVDSSCEQIPSDPPPSYRMVG